MEWRRDRFRLTTQSTEHSANRTFGLLQETYWGHKRSLEMVEKVLENSMCFFLLDGDRQIGFARVISDFTTTSWLSDVVLDDDYQNQGLGSWMVQQILCHPEISETQFALQTGTAQKFYKRLGFLSNESLMSTPVDYL